MKPKVSNRMAINEGLDDNSVCPDCHGFGGWEGCYRCGRPSDEYMESELIDDFDSYESCSLPLSRDDIYGDDEYEEPIDWFFL